MIRRPPRSTLSSSSAASDVYKRQEVLAGLQWLTVRGRCFLAAGVTCTLCGLALRERDPVRAGVLLAALPLVAVALVPRTRYRLACARRLHLIQQEPRRRPQRRRQRVLQAQASAGQSGDVVQAPVSYTHLTLPTKRIV